ncbi:molybdenum cofactor guanylyltransferase [Acidilobus saccharovorans]|uniref:molybdenum cofactor guanylyltransferase n=1 Tax=Acidilobus saccharovorans TaxID=242703 RepID=UPI0006625F89|nr:NTP transferase domain-containing protein [Acidilobus saccharovorans]
MPGKPEVIVVAGGSSSRFGSDKLLAPFNGRPLISRVLSVAAEVGDVIVVSSREEISRLGGLLAGARVVEDLPQLPCGGPPRGVASAIGHVSSDRVLVMPGDAAWATTGSLEALLRQCAERLASPLMSGGLVNPSFVCGPTGLLREAVDLMCSKASLGLRARMTDLLRSSSSRLVGASPLGGQARFYDLDVPGDRPPRSRGPRRTVELDPTAYRKAVSLAAAGDVQGAALAFREESAAYRRLRVWHLELHSLLDAQALGLDVARRVERLRALLRRPSLS